MRIHSLILLAFVSLSLSGCLGNDGTDAGGDSNAPGNGIAPGTALGDWTASFEGGPLAGAEAVDAEGNANCNTVPTSVGSHEFTLPSTDANGVAWVAKPLTITLTKVHEAAGELDIHLTDAEGNVLASNTQSDLMGEDPFVLKVSSLSPGDYVAQVHACSPTNGYTLDLMGSMVAA